MKGKTLLLSISAVVLLFLTQPARAQSAKISVKMENVSVKTVLDKIQEMTDYAFFYNNTEIDDS